MKIVYLSDHPTWTSLLARWHHDEWSHLNPKKTLRDRIKELERHEGHTQIPTTVIAIGGDKPLGSASLIEHDMDTHKEYSPWLAGVYVRPEHRRKGVGSALVRRVESEALKLGVRVFYLYTPDQEQLYARLGWEVMFREEYRGQPVVIMNRSF